ncbi:hypothetical protein Hanom_Chr12g01144031 [Helianthus anomalus]
MSGPFLKKLIIRFDGVAITDGWKSVVDQLGLKIGCLLVFTPFHPYSNFLLTTFNVAFDVVCKKKKNPLSNVCLVDDPYYKRKFHLHCSTHRVVHIIKFNISF